MPRRAVTAVAIVALAAAALVAKWPDGQDRVVDLTATGGTNGAQGVGVDGRVDTSARRLHPGEIYCDGRTRESVMEHAGQVAEVGMPESESAWRVHAAGLDALDPELGRAWRRESNASEKSELLFVVTVASGDAEPIKPERDVVAVDERRGHTAAVVLDCAGASAIRVFPPGFFPFGAPREFLDPAGWFSEWIGPDGRPATRSDIAEHSYSAEHHCAWDGLTILSLGGEQYVRDAQGHFADWPFETTYAVLDEIPENATNTGFTKQGVQLWATPPGDPRAVYIAADGRVERWPAAGQPILCA